MKQIVKMQFGSHVYGTNVPDSDTDYKGVFVPGKRDLVMQTATKVSTQDNTKKDEARKNTKDDIDFENFSLKGFLKLVAEGQTGPIDMLFTPTKWHDPSTDTAAFRIWSDIRENRDKLVSRRSSAFTGYCYRQAAKYGLKGSRLDALMSTIELLKGLGDTGMPLMSHAALISRHAAETEHVDLVDIIKKNKAGEIVMTETYLQVCGCKAGMRQSIKNAIFMYQNLYDKYGERAKLAQQNKGIDWKAVMHAVRVCHEAIELLTTGNITFPRPEADLLLKIRKGELPYSEVDSMIVDLLPQVKEAEGKSVLRPKPDMAWIDDFVYEHYLKQITE